jgi:hypothetical protein
MKSNSIAIPYRRGISPSGRGLFALWVLVSLIWVGLVSADLYYRAKSQAEMSQEVERDLDLVACTGPGCSGIAKAVPREKWADIAATYVQFGYGAILEWMVLPPALLLLVGLGGAALMRRRVISE